MYSRTMQGATCELRRCGAWLPAICLFMLLWIPSQALGGEITLWLEMDVYAVMGPQWSGQDAGQRVEWHIEHTLTGSLTFDLDSLDPGSPNVAVSGRFSPGVRRAKGWGIYSQWDQEMTYLGERLLRLPLLDITQPKFALSLNEAGRMDIWYEPPTFLPTAVDPQEDSPVPIPQQLPAETATLSLPPVANLCRPSLQNASDGSRPPFPLRIVYAEDDVLWLASGRIGQLDGQPYLGAEGRVMQRAAALHQSPHHASRKITEVAYGDPYSIVDVWEDRNGQTWLLLDMGQQTGWLPLYM